MASSLICGTRRALLGRRRAFTPASIPGLVLWLDPAYGLYQETTGSSATTPAVADGDPVGTWAARTGQYLTAPSDAARPTLKFVGGLPTVLTDGVDDTLAATFAQAQPFSWYLAVRAESFPGINPTIIDGMTQNTGRIFNGTGGSGTHLYAGGLVTGADLSTGTKQVVAGVFNGASSSLSIDGGTPATGDAGTTALDGAAVAGQTDGQLGNVTYREIVLYSAALSAADDARLVAYLKSRWGL